MKRRLLERLHRIPGRVVDGESIFERGEWDILCVLDGCRVDTFREFHPNADAYRSVASTSKHWLQRTFGDRDVSDVGYISGNPFAAELDGDRFGYFHLDGVCEHDSGIETVAPAQLRDRATAVWGRRDELDIEQLVIHFMQPHVPFRSRPEWFDEYHGTDTWGSATWYRAARGEIDTDAWQRAYKDNLKWVLAEGVAPLARRCTGTIAVTSDHGNALGEWGIAGHPNDVAVPSVRRVPWWGFEGEKQCADVAADSDLALGLDTDGAASVDRDRQLRALGYK